MKKIKLVPVALLVLVAVLFNACKSDKAITSSVIQKRKYNKGFFVDLSSKKKATQTTAAAAVVTKPETIAKAEPVATPALAVQQPAVVLAQNTPVVVKNDVNTLQASTSKAVVGSSARKYISEETSAKMEQKLVQGEKQKSERQAPSGGSKSWIAALLLCFFLGGLGIHRFYLGYTWQGIVQLLTGGGCGVWALIDFIRIIIKDLKPKDGDYN